MSPTRCADGGRAGVVMVQASGKRNRREVSARAGRHARRAALRGARYGIGLRRGGVGLRAGPARRGAGPDSRTAPTSGWRTLASPEKPQPMAEREQALRGDAQQLALPPVAVELSPRRHHARRSGTGSRTTAHQLRRPPPGRSSGTRAQIRFSGSSARVSSGSRSSVTRTADITWPASHRRIPKNNRRASEMTVLLNPD